MNGKITAPAATEACALCSGNGFYGTPGQRCELCKGSRKAITPPAATEVPSDINWKVVGVLIEAHMTASRYHTAGTSNWGAALYKALRREFPAVGASVQPVQASLSDGLQKVAARREVEERCMKEADRDGRVFNAQGHQQAISAIDFCVAALASSTPTKGGASS